MKCDFCGMDLDEVKKQGGMIVEGVPIMSPQAPRICSFCVKLAKQAIGDLGKVRSLSPVDGGDAA